jgi:protein dpy-30
MVRLRHAPVVRLSWASRSILTPSHLRVPSLAPPQTPGLFNQTIVNNKLETAVLEVAAAIEAHRPGTVPGAAEALAKHFAAEAAAPATPAAPVPEAAPAAAAAAVPAAAAAPLLVAAPAAPATAAAIARHGALSPPAANGNGAAAALLDLGLGSPAAGAKGGALPVRAYMDATVVPVLREGLKALNSARPEDPLQFLAEFLLAQRAARGGDAPQLLIPSQPRAGAAVGPVA